MSTTCVTLVKADRRLRSYSWETAETVPTAGDEVSQTCVPPCSACSLLHTSLRARVASVCSAIPYLGRPVGPPGQTVPPVLSWRGR